VSFSTLFCNSRNGYSNEEITFIHTHIHDKQLEKNSKKKQHFHDISCSRKFGQNNLEQIFLFLKKVPYGMAGSKISRWCLRGMLFCDIQESFVNNQNYLSDILKISFDLNTIISIILF